jgi:hypothetical protein
MGLVPVASLEYEVEPQYGLLAYIDHAQQKAVV